MNALERIVRVLFKGEDAVSPAAGSAEKSIAGFGSTVSTVMKSIGALLGGLALGAFFKKSVEEAQASRVAMGQLALAVDNSGASFKAMEPEIQQVLAALAKTTKFGDDEFASAMQSMTLKTGDARWALNNLGQAADLAAAAGVPLEASATALAKAHEGNTKTLFALVPQLKGVTDWQTALAEATRGAADAQLQQLGPLEQIKKQFGEVQEAVGKAILGNSDFTTSGFGVADMLANLAEWIEANGAAFTGMLSTVVQVGQTFSGLVAPSARILASALLILNTGVREVWFSIQSLALKSEHAVGQMLSAFGTLLEKGGSLLKIFGVTVVEGMGKKVREGGEEMVGRTENIFLNLKNEYDAHQKQTAETWRAIWSDANTKTKTGGETVASSMRTGMGKTGDEVDAGAERIKRLIATKLGPSLAALVSTTEIAIRDLAKAAAEQLPPETVAKFDAHMVAIAANAKLVEERLTGIKPPIESSADASKEMAGDISSVARSALDVASAFGVIDRDAQSALNSVVNIADGMSKIAGGQVFAGVAGILGGVANIVSVMMNGDAERRRLVAQNNDRLRELRDEIGTLDLNITGEDFAKTKSAMDAIAPMLNGGWANAMQNLPTILRELGTRGITFGDLQRMFDELGGIRGKDGSIDLGQLFQLLGQTPFATFGQDFASQLRSMMAGFDVNNTDDAGQVSGLGALGGRFSPLLQQIFNPNDLAGSRVRLGETLTRLQNGGVSATEIGGFTGNQFLDLITDLMGRIDGLVGTVDGGVPGIVGLSGIPTGGVPGVGGIDVGRAATLGDVVDSVTSFHDDAVGLLTQSVAIQEQIAQNTLDALKYLGIIAAGGRGGNSDDEIGLRLSIERRLQGNPAL